MQKTERQKEKATRGIVLQEGIRLSCREVVVLENFGEIGAVCQMSKERAML